MKQRLVFMSIALLVHSVCLPRVSSRSEIAATEQKKPAAILKKRRHEHLFTDWRGRTRPHAAIPRFYLSYDDLNLEFYGRMKPEFRYGRHLNLLNSCVDADQEVLWQHTFDWGTLVRQGFDTYGYDVITFKADMRQKGRWGDPAGILRTSNSDVKLADAVFGSHNHSSGLHLMWVRELWTEFALNPVFDVTNERKHFLRLGLQPFELGRGIALGEAFAVGSRLLGFYSDDVVDQYAPAFRLFGEAAVDRVTYDFYTAILQNNSTSFARNNEKIYAQRCGFRTQPQRGFGHINFVSAAQFNIIVFDQPNAGVLTFRPYALYNGEPEQRIEFRGDARSKLGTFGAAIDYVIGDFTFGFEGARNVGSQEVFCWDRNIVQIENRNGLLTEVNSHVFDSKSSKVVYVPGSANQTAILASQQCAQQNGQMINDDPELVNGSGTDARFRDCQHISYKGWMFVADASYRLSKDVKLVAELDIASGDDSPYVNETDPNASKPDGDFRGFLGLQEIYNGRLVHSVLVLGSRKVPRPLSQPTGDFKQPPVADSVSEFTNIIALGGGVHVLPLGWDNKLSFEAHAIAFWQEHASKKFDITTGKRSDKDAAKFLGLELNAFLDWNFYKNMRAFVVTSMFFPGQHYDDIQGIPLTAQQAKLFDKLDKTGFSGDPVSLLGTCNAYTFVAGIAYHF